MADDSITFALDAKLAQGAEKARQDVAVGVSVVFTLIGMTTVGLRIYTRAFVIRNMGAEDWTAMIAALFAVIFLITIVVSAQYGMGYSMMSVTPEQMVINLKLGLTGIAVYKMTVTLIKISILLIYLRLAVTKTFGYLCKGSIVLLALYQFTVLIIVPLECAPITKLWNSAVPGRCIDINTFYYITSAFHIFMDVWILILPYKLIISIPRPLRERLAVYSVFGLGFFGTLCAIIRFNYLIIVSNSKDPFYDSLPINVWSVVEVNVGMVCASLPTLRPLFSKTQRSRTRQALKTPDEESMGSNNGKRKGLLQVKEMFISITTGTFMGSRTSTMAPTTDEYKRMTEFPPPVPPKDMKAAKMRHPTAVYSKV